MINGNYNTMQQSCKEGVDEAYKRGSEGPNRKPGKRRFASGYHGSEIHGKRGR
jgi:hypothetical protein